MCSQIALSRESSGGQPIVAIAFSIDRLETDKAEMNTARTSNIRISRLYSLNYIFDKVYESVLLQQSTQFGFIPIALIFCA